MCESPETDAFTQNVMNHIDPKVYASLRSEQAQAFREAIFKCRPARKHIINIRGFLPLIFARFYFVFLLGRDRRSEKQQVDHDRRNIRV